MSAPVASNRCRLDDAFAKIKIPCLHMTGTKDSSPIDNATLEDRRLPFGYGHSSDQYLITFTDDDDMIF